MQNNRYFPMTLLAVAMASGCSSIPQNPALIDAHSRYNSAQSDPNVTNLAALELKDASDSLNKADTALGKDESVETVNHLAYLATQQVGIAQEIAKRKTAELAVTNADAKRNEVRLDARTAEADAANANVARDQVLIAQLEALNAQKTDRGMVITLGDVLFNTGKAQLKSGGVRNVQKLADFLNQYPQYKVLVEGHTDSVGSEDFNQELSERRADAVQTALMQMNIGSDRVAMRGYGEGFPVASNENAGGRQLNRRVEIILSDANGNIVPR
ncbi:MAG: OmpA family protein [Methylovulum sp.]|nr:OmpA family protein [Methylovulum sp.]